MHCMESGSAMYHEICGLKGTSERGLLMGAAVGMLKSKSDMEGTEELSCCKY